MENNKRIYAHYILYQGKIYINTILEIGECNIRLFPFEQEIANTVFISGIVVVNKDISEEHRREICEIFKSEQDTNLKAKEINNYLKKNYLFSVLNSKFEILYYDAGKIKSVYKNKSH